MHKEILDSLCLLLKNCADCLGECNTLNEMSHILSNVTSDSFCIDPYDKKTNAKLKVIAKKSNYNLIEKENCLKFVKITMTKDQFLSHCTLCGGNWGAMLLTGISKVFPEKFQEVEEKYNSFSFNDGGIKAFSFLCDFLDENGIEN